MIGFSSQYDSTLYSAKQALLPENTFFYVDSGTSWLPSSQNGTKEYLTVGFPVPVYATGAMIRENSGNGFVTQIDALDVNNVLHTVWKGKDASKPGSVANLLVSWIQTNYLVKGIKVYVDTNHDLANWEAIDAIQLYGTPSSVSVAHQWADFVIGFSSQYSVGGWSAAQMLGEPNTFGYGDINTSWTSTSTNGTQEYVTLGFDVPVYADGVTVRETDGNGFVSQIDVVDMDNILHTVWTGVDTSLPGNPVDFLATWSPTGYLVKGVKIYVDTNHDLSNWEEIDAVQLHGNTAATGALPVITGVSPATANAGGPDMTLSLAGSSFAANSVVYWTMSSTVAPLATTFVSSTEIKAVVPALLTAKTGNATLTVVTPSVGGSAAKAFSIVYTTVTMPSATLSRDMMTGVYTATITLMNAGYKTAPSVMVATGSLGAAKTGVALPISLGDMAGGVTAPITLTFPSTAGVSGHTASLKVTGTFTGGKFTCTVKFTLP